MAEDQLDVLLIEDNPGDVRLIEEMLNEAGKLLQRVEVGASRNGTQIHHQNRVTDGLERLADTDVDVILLDLNLPDSSGLDTLAAVSDATDFVPIVVLTGLRDEHVGLEAIQHGAQDYLVKGEVTADLLVRSIHYAVERTRQEYQRAQRREQLQALNRLNRISQDVTHAVISTTTREELERVVCERLVESDAYRFAWIGEVDRGAETVVPRTSAGIKRDYLDKIDVTIGTDETAQGPTGRAVQTRSVQVIQNILTDPTYEPWREEALERGYRSSAAIPIVYENLLYGVLNVYASSANAFFEPEIEILTRMGDVIGHAITAIERKNALTTNTVLEFEFRVEGVADELVALSTDGQCTITLENLIRSDDDVIAYGRADGISSEDLLEVVAREAVIDDFRVLAPDTSTPGFELVTSAVTPLFRAVGSHGGRVRSATIADGEFRFVVEFPAGRDRRQLVELIDEHCVGSTPHSQRVVQRPERTVTDFRAVFHDRLTEKQRTALEASYAAGFFDWPRGSTGQEIADRLGITPSTFTQHLRAAERKFFDAVFDEDLIEKEGRQEA